MRIITGSGKLIREYIKNLVNFDNVIVLPENGLDVNEQANFMLNLLQNNPDFSGDIITLSSFILSDIKEDEIFILNDNSDMSSPGFNTFGASVNKINFNIFKNKNTIGDLSHKKLKEFKALIKSENISNKLFFEIDNTFGESTEKFLLLKMFYK